MNDPFLPEELRLFVACELPPSWLEALGRTMRELSRAGLGQLRWVRPEGIHLTLKFLGEVGRHLLPDLQGAMEGAAAAREPFDLRLGALGTFGGRGRTRVVWAGVDGDLTALRQLHADLDARLAELGFARETRPFAAHLTLARVPEGAPSDTASHIVTALQSTHVADVDAMTVSAMALIRSQLSPGGATYTRLVSTPFTSVQRGQ